MASSRKKKPQKSQTRTAFSARTASRSPRSTAGGHRGLLTEVDWCVAEGDSFSGALSRLARACVPEVAEQCFVDLLTAEGTVRRLEAAHADPAMADAMRMVKRDYAPREANPVMEVFRSGRSNLTREWNDEVRARIAHDPVHLQILRRFGPKSSMSVPVNVHGKTMAVLSFCITGSERRLDDGDLELAEDIARRAGAALEPLVEG
jgi:GAF domain-containing protein